MAENQMDNGTSRGTNHLRKRLRILRNSGDFEHVTAIISGRIIKRRQPNPPSQSLDGRRIECGSCAGDGGEGEEQLQQLQQEGRGFRVSVHRYPEEHKCTFDFMEVGKKANPLIKADKLERL